MIRWPSESHARARTGAMATKSTKAAARAPVRAGGIWSAFGQAVLRIVRSLHFGRPRLNVPTVTNRYDLREDDAGLTVYDLWTGTTVVIAGAEQTGLLP